MRADVDCCPKPQVPSLSLDTEENEDAGNKKRK